MPRGRPKGSKNKSTVAKPSIKKAGKRGRPPKLAKAFVKRGRPAKSFKSAKLHDGPSISVSSVLAHYDQVRGAFNQLYEATQELLAIQKASFIDTFLQYMANANGATVEQFEYQWSRTVSALGLTLKDLEMAAEEIEKEEKEIPVPQTMPEPEVSESKEDNNLAALG